MRVKDAEQVQRETRVRTKNRATRTLFTRAPPRARGLRIAEDSHRYLLLFFRVGSLLCRVSCVAGWLARLPAPDRAVQSGETGCIPWWKDVVRTSLSLRFDCGGGPRGSCARRADARALHPQSTDVHRHRTDHSSVLELPLSLSLVVVASDLDSPTGVFKVQGLASPSVWRDASAPSASSPSSAPQQRWVGARAQ